MYFQTFFEEMKKLSVTTDFNVSLELDGDTLGRRILAFAIDFIIIVFYLYMFEKVFHLIRFRDNGLGDASKINWGLSSLLLLPVMFYTLTWEVLTNGYTPGKFIMKVKVIKLNGYHPTFVDYFIRWIFRIFEIYSFIFLLIIFNQVWALGFLFLSGLVATFIIATNKKGQRVGDIIAGTVVTNSKYVQDINITILENVDDNYKPVFPGVIKLSDNDMRIIKDTYHEAKKADDFNKIARLRQKVQSVLGIESDLYDYQFFDTIIKDFNYYTKKQI